MKKIAIVLLLSSTLLLAACSNNNGDTVNSSSKVETKANKKEAVIKVESIIDQFKKENLPVDNPKSMTKDDFGMAPMSAKEAYVFGVSKDESGEFMNARIFSFNSIEDLRKTKSYYDDLGKDSAMLFSFTASNEKKKVLMQFNGDLPQGLVQKYADSANLTLTPTGFNQSTESSSLEMDNSTVESTFQEDIANDASEQEANDYPDENTTTNTPQQQSTPQQDLENLSLADFVDKYGMTPAGYKIENGMSEEEALRTTQQLSYSEKQIAKMKYGITD